MALLRFPSLAWVIALLCIAPSRADDSEFPTALSLSITNGKPVLQLPLYPGADEFDVFSSSSLNTGFSLNTAGRLNGYSWTDAALGGLGFYKLRITPMPADALLTAIVLNRLAYGPTPDELERLAGRGPDAFIAEQLSPETISETLDIDVVRATNGWRYITATGPAPRSRLFIYLSNAGEGYVDDVKFVRGTVPEVGVSLVRNGDFELPLTTNEWFTFGNHTNSLIVTGVSHSGNSSMKLVASGVGNSDENSVWQLMTGMATNQQYTLSYWYLPSTTKPADVTIRTSASTATSGIFATSPVSLLDKLSAPSASLRDLRVWHILHAVRSQKQLLEVLLQFLDNHFVTQESKSRDYLDTYYDGSYDDYYAVQLEYKELQRWRQALLRPNCTFYDLLKISAESMAMIIYLDTVNSKGNGSNIANENYARELLELFTFGVDNGYDQGDITVMSRGWTGWSVDFVSTTNEFNPFASRSTIRIPGATNGSVSNLVGVWSFNFKNANHNTAAKTIFTNKTVAARFGPPYAGRNYQLVLPARTGTNGIKDGYEVIAHLADQPYTQEFLSVKLCRLFVHDDFATGYDFTDPNLSAEGKLVRACMNAWESSSPKGQIRPVLTTIFNSELFRTQRSSGQKVRTPFEFTVATIRALRSANTNGTFTAETDGASLQSAMTRMGSMNLFDRAEPDGYAENGPAWISAGTLAERLRFVQATCMTNGPSDRGGTTDIVGLLKKKVPSSSWNNSGAVADYFLRILYPGEGRANLNQYRGLAMKFLDTADNGVSASPFSTLVSTSAAYDTRVRGMVAMLMTLQRFHEQ